MVPPVMVQLKVTRPSGGITTAQKVAVSPQLSARLGLIATMSILGVPIGTVVSQVVGHPTSPATTLRRATSVRVNSLPVPAFTVTHRALGEVRMVPPVMVHVNVTVPPGGMTVAQKVAVSPQNSARAGLIGLISQVTGTSGMVFSTSHGQLLRLISRWSVN